MIPPGPRAAHRLPTCTTQDLYAQVRIVEQKLMNEYKRVWRQALRNNLHTLMEATHQMMQQASLIPPAAPAAAEADEAVVEEEADEAVVEGEADEAVIEVKVEFWCSGDKDSAPTEPAVTFVPVPAGEGAPHTDGNDGMQPPSPGHGEPKRTLRFSDSRFRHVSPPPRRDLKRGRVQCEGEHEGAMLEASAAPAKASDGDRRVVLESPGLEPAGSKGENGEAPAKASRKDGWSPHAMFQALTRRREEFWATMNAKDEDKQKNKLQTTSSSSSSSSSATCSNFPAAWAAAQLASMLSGNGVSDMSKGR